jgi:iron(III) transport system permease protein
VGGRTGNPGSRILLIVGALIALALVLPVLVLAVDARATGWHEIAGILFRRRSAELLVNTVSLAVIVTVGSAVVGTATAWLTERTNLVGRRAWTVLLVLPVAMPDFVVGYAWHTAAPTLNPLVASSIVMIFSSYPLVHLPVAAALRRADPALEDTARSLGVGSVATFLRVSLPLVVTALLSGSMLVMLAVISEYGAFEILRFQTFTTEIFTEFQFNPSGAAALSIPLVLIGLLVLFGESRVPRSPLTSRATAIRSSRLRLGRGMPVVSVLLGLLVALAVLFPIGALLYWIARSQSSTLPAQATVGQATATTAGYAAAGAALAVVVALPVAFLSARSTRRIPRLIDRSTYITQALPGVVIALCLVFFAVHFAYGMYETSGLLVIAYAILTFPLALSCLKTSVQQVPAVLPAIARSLGRGPVEVFFRVTLPLVAPGAVAGFCLVFLTITTELTATLVLAPLGVQTLATQFWAYQSESAYGAAAPYALVIVTLSLVPGGLLALWFDRGAPSRDRVLGGRAELGVDSIPSLVAVDGTLVSSPERPLRGRVTT